MDYSPAESGNPFGLTSCLSSTGTCAPMQSKQPRDEWTKREWSGLTRESETHNNPDRSWIRIAIPIYPLHPGKDARHSITRRERLRITLTSSRMSTGFTR